MPQRRRVAVTGMGVVSPLGCKPETLWKNLIAGCSGIGPIRQVDASKFKSRIAGEVQGFDPEETLSAKDIRHMDPFAQYGMAAAAMAVGDAGLDPEKLDARRVGVIVGTGIGGLQILQEQWGRYVSKGISKFSPFMIPQMITNILAGLIAIRFGFRGPNYCVTSACATGTHALGEGLRCIQYGDADVVLAGGAEAPVCELGIGGFCSMRALSTRNDEPQRASRPFDRERDGFVIAEGAGILVLEAWEHARARGATVHAELAGYGRTCDAYHITAPDEQAEGAQECMRLAMSDAGLGPADIDYINAHGTSTPLNDKVETLAIKKAFGETEARRVMISATKSMTGHLLGAAGAVEAVACILSLRDQAVPPTINYDHPDPACDLDYVPNTARETRVRACLNNSLGFGGHNATLCFKTV